MATPEEEAANKKLEDLKAANAAANNMAAGANNKQGTPPVTPTPAATSNHNDAGPDVTHKKTAAVPPKKKDDKASEKPGNDAATILNDMASKDGPAAKAAEHLVDRGLGKLGTSREGVKRKRDEAVQGLKRIKDSLYEGVGKVLEDLKATRDAVKAKADEANSTANKQQQQTDFPGQDNPPTIGKGPGARRTIIDLEGKDSVELEELVKASPESPQGQQGQTLQAAVENASTYNAGTSDNVSSTTSQQQQPDLPVQDSPPTIGKGPGARRTITNLDDEYSEEMAEFNIKREDEDRVEMTNLKRAADSADPKREMNDSATTASANIPTTQSSASATQTMPEPANIDIKTP